jgi:uncharacterized membrane protein
MKTTIGVFTTHATAEKMLQDLRDSNVNENDISYLYKNEDGDVKDGQSGAKMGTASSVGIGAGAVLGGIAGLVIANGIVPGFGSLIVSTSIAEAFGVATVTATTVAGAGVGAVTGGLIGALTHVGVSKDDVHLYEEHVLKGGVLVIARTENLNVKDMFMEHNAKDVQEYLLS